MAPLQHFDARWVVSLLGLFLGVSLACNAPTGEPAGVPEPPTIAATVAPIVTLPQAAPAATTTPAGTTTTLPAEGQATPAATPLQPLPTFTPIQIVTAVTAGAIAATASPVGLAPTVTQPAIGNPPTATKAPASGPLTLSYHIRWELIPGNPYLARAFVTLTAEGGNGDYSFYRDDLPLAGPVFDYQWASCRANPGSFRVDDSAGNSVRINYYEQTPCPTPVP
jgi:hypothetical protein